MSGAKTANNLPMNKKINSLVSLPDGFTPRVVVAGGTREREFKAVFNGMLPLEVTDMMDENASKVGLPFSPVMVIISEHTSGVVDAHMIVPLQKFSEPMRIEKSVLSGGTQRVMDYVAGLMSSFCKTESLVANDVTTGQVLMGDTAVIEVNEMLNVVTPKESRKITEEMYIGDPDEILKGLEIPQEPKVDPDIEIRKTQQEVVDKYGWKALEELSKQMKQKILIDKPM